MPELIHLNTTAFVIVSTLFMIVLLIALKYDIEDMHYHKKLGSNEEFKTKKCRVSKMCRTTCGGAMRGAITGAIIGGPGGAAAGACIMGLSGGLVAFIM